MKQHSFKLNDKVIFFCIGDIKYAIKFGIVKDIKSYDNYGYETYTICYLDYSKLNVNNSLEVFYHRKHCKTIFKNPLEFIIFISIDLIKRWFKYNNIKGDKNECGRK